MSVYQKISQIGSKFFPHSMLFKYGFNLSPLYKRSTAKIINVSDDLLNITIKLPISWKNKNYVNSIFGGSMFAAVDPIPMVQLMNLIGDDFVVWDKSAEIKFKRPAKEDLYADFVFSKNELEEIKIKVATHQEWEVLKTMHLTNKEKTQVFCEVHKTIYVADKEFYKAKRKKKSKKG